MVLGLLTNYDVANEWGFNAVEQYCSYFPTVWNIRSTLGQANQ